MIFTAKEYIHSSLSLDVAMCFGGLGEKLCYPSPVRRLLLIAFKMIGRFHAPATQVQSGCQPGLPWVEVGY